MVCSGCGHNNSNEAFFCENCGTALAKACASCGAELSATARFCSRCGTPVEDEKQQTVAIPAARNSMRPSNFINASARDRDGSNASRLREMPLKEWAVGYGLRDG